MCRNNLENIKLGNVHSSVEREMIENCLWRVQEFGWQRLLGNIRQTRNDGRMGEQMIFYREEVMWNIFRFFQSGTVEPPTEGTMINKIDNI